MEGSVTTTWSGCKLMVESMVEIEKMHVFSLISRHVVKGGD
jgi:hypothetical protein